MERAAGREAAQEVEARAEDGVAEVEKAVEAMAVAMAKVAAVRT